MHRSERRGGGHLQITRSIKKHMHWTTVQYMCARNDFAEHSHSRRFTEESRQSLEDRINPMNYNTIGYNCTPFIEGIEIRSDLRPMVALITTAGAREEGVAAKNGDGGLSTGSSPCKRSAVVSSSYGDKYKVLRRYFKENDAVPFTGGHADDRAQCCE
ncbi:hypothetical protein Tcan_16053 [Toxocara canis]|uniref:Uncharacterized protein n=1 Tax=Toxocara canis TaxID=6265 RepID=A0A0B2VJ97_TOXCA|nr:hypothetical protein Tcan_16053 [Toxocara canis]